MKRLCTVDGCERPCHGKGLCNNHYMIQYRATPAGKASAAAFQVRYRQTDHGKAARSAGNKRFFATPKGKEAAARNAAAARARHRERLAAARAGGCVDCGSQVELHFHHLDPTTKLHKVSEMDCRSDAVFQAEVAKCVVVCQSCHIERHAKVNKLVRP